MKTSSAMDVVGLIMVLGIWPSCPTLAAAMVGSCFIRARETNAQEQEERSFEPNRHATFPRVVMVHPCLPLSLYK
ncbi:hypothetical protein MUK42_21828 [Musa troglodytarum]|uniref:Secreted protein n=1 Tax=Musa troglodytarum TaxID=320322 RepID=A0A9E7GBG3_9LILI|nr:hypothetical protein MUK42_21828 [Musa troglodytarum]